MGRQLTPFAVGALCQLVVVSWLSACGSVDPGSGAPGGSAGQATVAGSSSGGRSGGGSAGSTPGTGGASTAGSSAAGDASGGAPDATDLPLMPWQEGNSWTYRITKNGVVTEKTTVVEALQVVGGTGPNAALMANHVTTDKGAADHTESWQAPSATTPGRVVRFREQAFAAGTGALQSEVYYDPEKLHVDGTAEHTLAGASWLEKYAETTLVVGSPAATHNVSERWTVIAADETLKVPAGTFSNVIHLQKVGNSTKDYWYARGVGKLKETGTQTEELSAYTLVP